MSPDNGDQPDLLRRLSTLNPTVVVLVTVALFLGVILLPDLAAAALLLVIAAGLLWLLRRTWPVLPNQQRVLRLVVIGLLLLVAAVRLFF